jgi:uncharacterized protein YqjF (DUF2071 family)
MRARRTGTDIAVKLQRASWEGRMSRWLAGIMISAIAISTDALSQQSLQGLESNRRFEQALRAVDAIKRRKKLQCVLSIANNRICECLAQKLPVDIYILSYASIASREKDGRDYEQLSAADKTIVDQCVIVGR